MKKYFLLSTLLLFTISVIAQVKDKQQKTPAPIREMEPPPLVAPNQIEHYAISESSLTQINAITLNGNSIDIKSLRELDELNLSQFKELYIKTQISGQSIDNNLLQKIIDNTDQLENLTIDNFAIETFPEIKFPNHYLKKLTLNRNGLKAIHPSISNLVNLEEFTSFNPLQEIPGSFSQLKNLKELGLYNVAFTVFPNEIFDLRKLTILYISGNDSKTKEIPDLFHQLPNLQEFGVTGTLISTLPESFSTLKKLERVSFSNNQFKEFPEALAMLTSLQFVPFDNNPLDWDKFMLSIKKIKWRGLFFLYETGFSKQQYEEIQKNLPKIDVYYDGMND